LPYLQTIDYTGKACHGQTLFLIANITDIKSFITLRPGKLFKFSQLELDMNIGKNEVLQTRTGVKVFQL
jgi:hypothetical protein